MQRGHTRWIVLLLTAIIAWGGFACVSACAADSCMPPCHAHSHASKSCFEQTATALHLKSPDLAPVAEPIIDVAASPLPWAAVTPPISPLSSFAVPASAVLRI